jgi:hypothetical protein
MKPYNDDSEFRDAYLNYLNKLYKLVTIDYSEIIKMGEIAQDSYEKMEAYFKARETASKKMEDESKFLNEKMKEFAKNNNIKLTESKNEITEKLEVSAKVMNYYNKIFLIFFKSHSKEMYLLKLLESNNIDEIEKNRKLLLKFSNEGLKKLKSVKPFKNDITLKNNCINILIFYKNEASQKILLIIDFLNKNNSFEKIKKEFEAIKENKRTQKDVDKYNNSVNEVNEAVKIYNKTIEELNKERMKFINKWNKSSKGFLDSHIPY